MNNKEENCLFISQLIWCDIFPAHFKIGMQQNIVMVIADICSYRFISADMNWYWPIY